ncbi:sensor histidine kinase [Leptolyngbya sp. AN02str]|uniref:sensor histidine kinase n=1 Tax=Leptolyngbya sp. AN02str TaxID=3423363 RepID=UPI003D312492
MSTLVGIGTTVCFRLIQGLMLENLKTQMLSDVEHGAHQIDNWLTARRIEVEMLANTPKVQSMDWEEAGPYLTAEELRIGQFSTFTLINPDGSYYNTDFGLTGFNLSDRPWFQKALAGEAAFSDPIVARSLNLPVVTISAPIRQVGQTTSIGVLGGAIAIDTVTAVVNAIPQVEGSYAFALNSQGVAITHPNSDYVSHGNDLIPSLVQSEDTELGAIAAAMVAGRQNVVKATLDGKSYYVAYMTLNEVDWSLALAVPSQAIDSQLYPLYLMASVMAALLLIAMFGAWKQLLLLEKTRKLAAQELVKNRINSRIRETLNLSCILQAAIDDLGNQLDLDHVLFGWFVPSSQQFEIVQAFPVTSYRALAPLQPKPGETLADCLAEQLGLYLISDDGYKPIHAGTYSALAIPGDADRTGYLIGVDAKKLTKSQQSVLVSVSDQLAIAIKQVSLYQQTQEQVGVLNDTLNTLKATQLQLVQSEKMSSLGQMVAGIAHEINNPVNFIHGNISHASDYTSELLDLISVYQEEYPHASSRIQNKVEAVELEFLKEDLPKLLSSIQVGAHRIREIVQSLRTFSRLDEAEVKDVDIHEGIDSTLMILQSRLKPTGNRPGIEIVKQYGNIPLVECYAGQLNQVFMNIISNAIDALEEHDRQRSEEELQHTPSTIAIATQLIEPGWIRIHIADNGPGIPNDVAPRIFDPFFTTKLVGKGTGMGLAISYQIVTERHRGRITCHSTPGCGTEFMIEIPVEQHVADAA